MRFSYLCAILCGVQALAILSRPVPVLRSLSSTSSATDSGASTTFTAKADPTFTAGTTPPPLPSSATSVVTVSINVTLSAVASA